MLRIKIFCTAFSDQISTGNRLQGCQWKKKVCTDILPVVHHYIRPSIWAKLMHKCSVESQTAWVYIMWSKEEEEEKLLTWFPRSYKVGKWDEAPAGWLSRKPLMTVYWTSKVDQLLWRQEIGFVSFLKYLVCVCFFLICMCQHALKIAGSDTLDWKSTGAAGRNEISLAKQHIFKWFQAAALQNVPASQSFIPLSFREKQRCCNWSFCFVFFFNTFIVASRGALLAGQITNCASSCLYLSGDCLPKKHCKYTKPLFSSSPSSFIPSFLFCFSRLSHPLLALRAQTICFFSFHNVHVTASRSHLLLFCASALISFAAAAPLLL